MYKLKTLFGLLFLLIISASSIAQKYTISGYVQDLRSGERIISASVYDLKTKQGTITNDYGFFSLTLPSDTVELSISFVGYAAYSSVFYLDSDI